MGKGPFDFQSFLFCPNVDLQNVFMGFGLHCKLFAFTCLYFCMTQFPSNF